MLKDDELKHISDNGKKTFQNLTMSKCAMNYELLFMRDLQSN